LDHRNTPQFSNNLLLDEPELSSGWMEALGWFEDTLSDIEVMHKLSNPMLQFMIHFCLTRRAGYSVTHVLEDRTNSRCVID